MTTYNLLDFTGLPEEDIFRRLDSSAQGLTSQNADSRRQQYGPNKLETQVEQSIIVKFLKSAKDPLSILLLILGTISFITSDIKGSLMIAVMLAISVLLRFFQELNADKAAKKLKALVTTTASVLRDQARKEISFEELVPGDLITLSAGDLVPGDVRLISSKDLYVNQSVLTGESFPAEKHAQPLSPLPNNIFEANNLCLLGTHVESGVATAIVVKTGQDTYLGSMTEDLSTQAEVSDFDRGIDQTTWLFIRFMAVMVPAVFLINGLARGNWLEAFLFALAVAVGLTPEMLPAIVTVNLSKGAISMSQKKVIVKHLNAIQNFGAIDVLCTDKTGTLTEGKVSLIKHLDINGQDTPRVLDLAIINSYFQTGLKNLMDEAVLSHDHGVSSMVEHAYQKIDEIPYDFTRRRMSVVAADSHKHHLLVTKGALEEMLPLIKQVEIRGKNQDFASGKKQQALDQIKHLNQEGFRVLVIAYKHISSVKKTYSISDENNLTLLGFLAFLDPAKETATTTLASLRQYGLSIKILTGDNLLVTQYICRQVGLTFKTIISGDQIENSSTDELPDLVENNVLFCRLLPHHKEKIIKALQVKGHVVGFLGDGINDASALKAADVGISVDSAVDVAKESSDIILLEKSLLILRDGVLEGRKVFGNIIKYIKMAASSNFGNMFSVVGGSLFLPFLPMLPLQVLTNNLLYDISQTTISTDNVDPEYLVSPRKWRLDNLKRFIIFIGPLSSIFDYATYFVMLYVFGAWTNPALFHTGWFVESLVSQTLIIHVLRTNKIPFLQSRASLPMFITTLGVVALGIYLPFSHYASIFGFVPLPRLYWLYLMGFVLAYITITQTMKRFLISRFHLE